MITWDLNRDPREVRGFFFMVSRGVLRELTRTYYNSVGLFSRETPPVTPNGTSSFPLATVRILFGFPRESSIGYG